ncbi:MAG: hypothetical protein SFZ03_10175 [Candidatus Melainabacteria bacterium]|nr:hypothetical protein [Candidatus Melainabacteria bacterium]
MTEIIPQTTQQQALTLDVVLYQRYLENTHLDDLQKQELLQALWSVISEFIFLGFGLNSTQLIQDPCGQGEELSTENVKTHPVDVDSMSQGKAFEPFAQHNAAPNAQDIRGGVHG